MGRKFFNQDFKLFWPKRRNNSYTIPNWYCR